MSTLSALRFIIKQKYLFYYLFALNHGAYIFIQRIHALFIDFIGYFVTSLAGKYLLVVSLNESVHFEVEQ